MVGVSIISVFAFSQWKGMFSAFSHAYGQYVLCELLLRGFGLFFA